MTMLSIGEFARRSRLSPKALRLYDELGILRPAREVWDLAEQFLSYFREQPTPLLEGRRGAPFLVYHGEVSADSDGPVEFCRPIPGADSEATAARYPDLELRIEPAHEEAVVPLGTDPREGTPWPVVVESLFSWASEHGREPSDLGLRLTYLFVPPLTRESVPDIDLAVPLARA